MDPIRSRTPSPARELQAGSQPDAVQPIADRLVSPPAGSPLDGLPARRTMSRTQLPSPPASVPAFSAGSFSDLLRQVDSSLFDASFFDSMPAFGAHHAQAATGELDEAQSALRAADDPQPPVRVAVTAARPPRAKPAQRPRRAAQTSDASPAADVDLSTFGYSQQQQEKIKPTVRSTVAQHHAALVGHGFTHAHIVELSKHPAALGTIAARYSEMIAVLPEATHEDIVGVGKQWSGARALEALLMVAEELRAPPLQLVTGQLLKIAKRGGVTAVEAVHASRNALTGAPLHLTPDQVVAIASNGGAKQALKTVQRLLPVLCQPPYGLTPNQVVAIASNNGGKPALETVQRLLPVLCKPPYNLTPNQVVAIASHDGAKQALETVQRLLPVLCQEYGLTPNQVVAIASHDGAKQALETVQRLLPVLCKPPYGLTPEQVVAIASNNGGKQALETVQRLLPVLCQDHGLTPEQVVAIASNIGGKQSLETVQRLLPVLCQPPYGLTPEQVVAIASHGGAKQALKTVQRLLPVLCQNHGLTPEQVVAIANHDGAKQALETVQRLLPVLCKPPYGLTPEQVVAIASNDGGKQALETVQRLLPVLCKPPYNLTPEQVVAIASHGGGKQSLETVQRLLPVLRQPPYGLTPEQVVAIANNIGAKQALETVQRLLPVLCKHPYGLTPEQVVAIAGNNGGKPALETVQRLLAVLCQPPYGLTPNQVVAIASHDGGTQALESIFAQLSSPDPALAALTNDRLVALACIGGRPALDAVKKGLPHAPELITRVHNRVPEGTAHLVADHAQVVRVLGFFQCHSQRGQVFHEAMKRFEMSREGLLQLFRRVGVTELEAISGTLPPASQRWDRMLQASGRKGAKPPSASAQTQGQESLDAFADSLERELDAPSPMHQAGQTLASTRKRSRPESSVNRSSAQQAAEVFVPEQRDAPPLLPLSSWGVKRRRTRIGGLPDPGTPTHGDLAASSAAFLEQDADPFAGAAEDFPAFDQDELAWLKELLAH
ncbi:type III secretion system effector avirulence protein AvrBs3 [Xanthomonas translucens]|uniref:Type III secretion system effector avirulence protein AvrBs3 n=2 Tax=Xanthomonas campestris pv. translucens TaxID=343 RepID=A0ABW9KY64_XANCT|nr:type III secretion system effector avirulence protein AvrBs3 [Xanthomonas translucens]MQS42653.1 avirulence protein [Xanthomonas translucens pv. translucens]QSQ32483.1 TAL effector repeat-containing protein [Xanthomonas translucens pv. translucens]QSQ36792.1 TAL effector repeat-containing protein [Xanthomonas translucens pv. translucens]QSQ46600.1 TAL effector repeat-containing protein [Xanthomonas translucens pv. translucens]UKE59070.1 TAL effector repeat-containing protein [Xanthomonas tr